MPTPGERDDRAARARRLRDQGLTLRQIADRLSCSWTTIRRDLEGTGPPADRPLQAATLEAHLAAMTPGQRRQLGLLLLGGDLRDARPHRARGTLT